MGIVRSTQLVATLIVALPVAVMGALNIYDGQLALGLVFVGLAVGIVVLSEYVYGRLVGGTVGRVRRLGDVPAGLRDRLRDRREEP